MNKEKIVLGNKTELSYDSITINNGCLIISFIGDNELIWNKKSELRGRQTWKRFDN